MPNGEGRGVPFLSREQLRFGSTSTFSLRVIHRAFATRAIRIAGFTRDGAFTFRMSAASNTSPTTTDFRIPDVPLGFTVFNSDTDTIDGSVYVQVQLLIDGDPVMQLCDGLVDNQTSISFPFNNTNRPTLTSGQRFEATSANPAAGAELTLTAPDGVIWDLEWLRFQLVTDATAANRRVHITHTTFGGPVRDIISSVDQAASLTRNYSGTQMGTGLDEADDNDIIIPLPQPFIVRGGDTLASLTVNLQAGDNFGVMNVIGTRYFAEIQQ